MNESEEVLFEPRAAVGWLTLNRPQKANALSMSMMAALIERLERAAADAATGALVITGSGERAFSGGVDVRSTSELPPQQHAQQRSERFFRLLLACAEFPKPLVAAVNGVASGGGLMLAMLADRVVAVEGAALALPEIDLGMPTFAGMAILRHFGGNGLAADLALTGRRMPAAEARTRGLLAETVAGAAELAERAQQCALSLAAKPAYAFALSKRWLNAPLVAALHEAHRESEAARRAAS